MVRLFRIVCAVVLAGYLAPSPGFSQSNVSETGKAGMSFLTIAPSSRIASLGSSGSACMTGASSLWSNPALLAVVQERSAQFTHTEWIEGIKQEYAAFSTPFDYGMLGLGFNLFDSGDIDGRDLYGNDTGMYSITNAAITLTCSGAITDKITLGLTWKKLFQKVSDETASGYAFDAGLVVKTPIRGLSVAAAGRNYGRMGKLKSSRTKLPSDVSIGCLYDSIAPVFKRPWHLLGDLVFPRYGDTGVRLGTEIEAVKSFIVRIGYRSDSEFETFSFGIGYNWEMVAADIAYTPMRDMSDDALRFTLSLMGF